MPSTDSNQRPDIRPLDHDERMAVARRFSGWHLGSPAWADAIIGCYLWPDEGAESLRREREGK